MDSGGHGVAGCVDEGRWWGTLDRGVVGFVWMHRHSGVGIRDGTAMSKAERPMPQGIAYLFTDIGHDRQKI